MRPAVSIGLPVYNGMPLLRGAVASLLAQTASDFELIVSDNASTDETSAVCEALAARDRRVRYVRQPVNVGMLRNFAFVLQMARAPYFMWAAHDDEWDRHYIERLKACLDSDSSYIGAFGAWRGIDEQGRIVAAGQPIGLGDSSALCRLRSLTFEREDKYVYGLFRSEALKRLDMRPWVIAPDRTEEYTHTWLFYLAARGKIAECSDALFFYRIHRKPMFPPGAMARVKLNQMARTAPAVWRASRSPYLTAAATAMNTFYQGRNFCWMLFKRRFGLEHLSHSDIKNKLRRRLGRGRRA